MKTLQSILLTSILTLTTSCATKQEPYVPYKTDASRKELVKTSKEVITNARKHSLPIYAIKRRNRVVGYYTEGIVTETKEKVGRIEYGYESTDNFYLLDDDTSNGPKVPEGYSVEKFN